MKISIDQLFEMSKWENGEFGVYDPEPANHHSEIYLKYPNGQLVACSGNDGDFVDIGRVKWMAEVLNCALKEFRDTGA